MIDYSLDLLGVFLKFDFQQKSSEFIIVIRNYMKSEELTISSIVE